MDTTLTKWLVVGAFAWVVMGCVSFPDAQNAREVQPTQLIHVAAYGIDPQLPVSQNVMVREYPVDKIAAHTYVIHGPLG